MDLYDAIGVKASTDELVGLLRETEMMRQKTKRAFDNLTMSVIAATILLPVGCGGLDILNKALAQTKTDMTDV